MAKSKVNNYPELKLNTEDNDYVKLLERKLQEISDLYDQNYAVLEQIEAKRKQLNKEEETIQFELSGINGAKVVLRQLIEEAKDS